MKARSDSTLLRDVLALTETVQRAADNAAPRVSRPAYCPRCRAPAPRGQGCAECQPALLLEGRRALLATAVSSISSAHAGARFDNPHLATWVTIFEGIALAREAIDAERVIVVGPAGCGKTSLACAIGHAIIDRATAPDATVEDWKRAEGLRFFDAFDIANARQQSGRGDEAPVVREALRATVLILDDLGAEDHRLFGTAVEEVIHKRHRMIGVTTIVTTGFPEQRLAEIYGAGIARRLFEDAILIE